jgi:putative endonuclease
MKKGWVYIMANSRPTLYTGVTSNLVRRVWEHKTGTGANFTTKYKLTKLIFFEEQSTMMNAIIREKQIKNMSRKEKMNLIMSVNPSLKDLYPDLV